MTDIDGEICLHFKNFAGSDAQSLRAWFEEYKAFQNGKITREEYDEWRYPYPMPKAKRDMNILHEFRKKKD